MKVVGTPKDDVGRVLDLHDAPVVTAERNQSRAVAGHGSVQDRVQVGDVEAVGDLLGFAPVADRGKGIVA
jgi:hypothetical protein